jgi:hypothetical protein
MKQNDKIKLGVGVGILLVALVLIVWQSGLFSSSEEPAPIAVPEAPVQRGGGAMLPPPGTP